MTQFRLDQKVAEHWFGLTWSYKAAKHVGFGVTQYLAVRSHWSTLQESIETRTQANHIAMAFGSRQYSYTHFRTLWKIGLAADFKDVTLGLTLTTPSLDIGGKGTTGMNSTLAGLDTDGDGAPDDYLAADYTDGLDSYFQTPFSIAAGMTFKIQKIRIYWSTEWFAAVKPYTVVDAEEFPAQIDRGDAVDRRHARARPRPELRDGPRMVLFVPVQGLRQLHHGLFGQKDRDRDESRHDRLGYLSHRHRGRAQAQQILAHPRPRLLVRQPGARPAARRPCPRAGSTACGTRSRA